MAIRRSFLVLAFACFVPSTTEGVVFEPCYITDIPCLIKTTSSFAETIYDGLPKYDIKPFDPLIIPELDVVVDRYVLGLEFKFKNINITGLKKINVLKYEFNHALKSLFIRSVANIHVSADLTIVLLEKNKSFTGSYSATATTVLGRTYFRQYSIIKKGDEEYFELGPERHVCQITGDINVAVDSNLQNALNNDPDAQNLKPRYESNKYQLQSKAICKIMHTAFITLIHNIRAAGRSIPKNVFIKDEYY